MKTTVKASTIVELLDLDPSAFEHLVEFIRQEQKEREKKKAKSA